MAFGLHYNLHGLSDDRMSLDKITLCSQNQIRLTMILTVVIILMSMIIIIINRPLIVIATVFVIDIIHQLHGKQQVLMIFISETKFLHLLFIHNAKQEFTKSKNFVIK